jgi:hypothetical protein
MRNNFYRACRKRLGCFSAEHININFWEECQLSNVLFPYYNSILILNRIIVIVVDVVFDSNKVPFLYFPLDKAAICLNIQSSASLWVSNSWESPSI